MLCDVVCGVRCVWRSARRARCAVRCAAYSYMCVSSPSFLRYASLNKFNIRTCLESGIRDLNTVITKKQMDQIKEVEAKAAGGAGGGVKEEGKDE